MTDKPHKNVYVALAAAQMNMSAVVKGATNPHFKTKYADLADVMNVVIPALNAQGVAVLATIQTVGGQQFMRTTLMHGETETGIDCDVHLMVAKSDMQSMKSATTYAKRIGIESLCGIAPEDDDGNAAKEGAEKFKAEQQEAYEASHNKERTFAIDRLSSAPDLAALQTVWRSLGEMQKDQAVIDAKEDFKGVLQPKVPAAPIDDNIPY